MDGFGTDAVISLKVLPNTVGAKKANPLVGNPIGGMRIASRFWSIFTAIDNDEQPSARLLLPDIRQQHKVHGHNHRGRGQKTAYWNFFAREESSGSGCPLRTKLANCSQLAYCIIVFFFDAVHNKLIGINCALW